MIYCDTSALMKLYVAESESAKLMRICNQPEQIIVAEITWVEMRAALAQRVRMQLTTQQTAETALNKLKIEWNLFQKMPVQREVLVLAGDFAQNFGLRAYDSVQLACAQKMYTAVRENLLFCCYDKNLNAAAKALGIKVL